MQSTIRLLPKSSVIIILYFHFVLLQLCSNAQGWRWQNPQPFGDPLIKVFFINDQNGWMIPKGAFLLRTTDRGTNWEEIYTNITFKDIFFFDALEGWGIGHAGITETQNGNNIYYTIDGGSTWNIQLADTTVRYQIYFTDRLHGWATGDASYEDDIFNGSHLFKTTDSGNNWERSAIGEFRGGDQGPSFGVHFINNLTGWVVGGMFWGIKTTDGGETWVRDSSLALLRKIISTDSLHLWGLSDQNLLTRTTTGGDSWDLLSFIDTTVETSGRDIFALNENNVFIVSNIGIHYSNDGGLIWQYYSNQEMTSIFFLNQNEVWGAGTNGSKAGLFRSTNGGLDWENLITTNNPYGYEVYNAVHFINSEIGWITGWTPFPISRSFIIKTTDGGISWEQQEANNTNGRLYDIYFRNEENGWIVGNEGTILHTTDGGATWQQQISGKNGFVQKVIFTDLNNGWAVGGDFENGFILHTSNGGNTWIDQTPWQLPRMFSLSFIDSLTGWAATSYGSPIGSILFTNDGGGTWEIQRESAELYLDDLQFINSLHGWGIGYDPTLNSSIIHTSDGGITWEGQNAEVANSPHSIKFIDKFKGWIIGGHGIAFTSDGGNNWEPQKIYTSQWLQDIEIADSLTGWVVGNWGTILHTSTGGVTSINQNSINQLVLKDFVLYQNYPNPFNPATTIRFTLSKPGNVQLRVFNSLGELIETLADEHLGKGTHEFVFNASKYTSGIYYYQIISWEISQTRGMVLVK